MDDCILKVSQVQNGIILNWDKKESFNSGISIQWRGILLHCKVTVEVKVKSDTQAITIHYKGKNYKYGLGVSAIGAGFFGTEPRTPKIETSTHKFNIRHSRHKIFLFEESKNIDSQQLENEQPFKILSNPDIFDFEGSQDEYKTFLLYDQICIGMGYGITELEYKISDEHNTLSIKKTDRQNGRIEHLTIPLTKPHDVSDKDLLEDFLVNLLSYAGNFYGEPLYKSSEIFSKEEFEKMMKRGIEIMDEREQVAKNENLDNDIIKYCLSKNLNPEPEGSSPTNWKANCPSGGQHYIMISTKSNEWGCGYCREKGNLDDLKKWYESKH
jgi:hypothetical protein